MVSSLSRSRPLSLSPPISSEQEREHFQRRLGLSLLLQFGLASIFLGSTSLALLLTRPDVLAVSLLSFSYAIQIGTTLVGLAFAWLVRRGKPSARALGALDFISTCVACLGWSLICSNDRLHGLRIETISILACTYTLVTRAALLPSTPARSALISAVGLAPLVSIAWLLSPSAVDALTPLSPVGYMVIWALIGIACTTVISHVIYGLRMQVRRAMQLGQYTLEDKIGEGAMGVVYRARHALLRRPTAIKLLTRKGPEGAERFEREVQIMAELTHPNAVAVFDYGHTPDGVFYYAMEYLDGVSLDLLVAEHGPQPPARVVDVLLQVCGALHEAHSVGLVHRDIKPANIMLTERGRVPDVVKVLDFGLVRDLHVRDGGLSTTNTLVGTPQYMAPEAIRDPQTVDGRADLYALGATAFYLLTGEHVFDGKTLIEVCSQHLHAEPPRPSSKRPDMPEGLEAIVLRCLAKRPEDRPRDASELAALLRAVPGSEWATDAARGFWLERASRTPHTPRAVVLGPGSSGADWETAMGRTLTVTLEERSAVSLRANAWP
jgi:serine/threonine-protein kinase